jgi:NADH-quinone oxidoreductase subunit N
MLLAQVSNAPQSAHPPLSFGPVAPELILVGTAIVLMLLDALAPTNDQGPAVFLSLAGVVGAAAWSLRLWFWKGSATVLGGMVATDRFTVFFRLVILAVALIGILLSYHYLGRAHEGRGEYYPLLLFATAGMTLITAASDLILVFLALEVLSLSLYLLTGFSFRRLASAEASMKYFLLGAFSSAFFLYGVALAYGASGTTNLARMAAKLSQGAPSAIALGAAGLLAVGFLFKVSAAPFHMWTPDAYQGAPTCVTAFMSAGTKVAAFAAFLRVFNVAFHPLASDWRPFIYVIAAVSIVLGSVLAIAQTNVKRMLAYSSIAHAGFVLVGFAAANQRGIEAAMFYLGAYAATIVGAFGIVELVSVRGEANIRLQSYAGLARRNPLAGGALAIFLLSLAGIPPTAGFIAKVAVFSAAIQTGLWPLVLLAVLASVVAAFFYIRVIVLMYMRDYEPLPDDVGTVDRGSVGRLAVLVPAAVTVVFGILPGILFGFLRSASVIRF